LDKIFILIEKRKRSEKDVAGIVAIYNLGSEKDDKVIYYLAHSMLMLQHRGKAYWQMAIGKGMAGREGSFPSDDSLLKIIQQEKLYGTNGIGYLSKRSPQFPSMNAIRIALDGFFVDTEKLHLHPYIGSARNSDSLFKIYYIFKKLLIERQNAERAAEFLDRHLRGNLIIKLEDEIYAYRNSTGFKPLVSANNKSKTWSIIASENSLRASLTDMDFVDVNAGQLIKLSKKNGFEILVILPQAKIMMDPFEFIRESHVATVFNGKSIYAIRKSIGKEQAKVISKDIRIDSAYAEPDYTRPMTLGFSIEYQRYSKTFQISEGIIKDRYDDSDHMIDFSEQVSKNKLLTTGKSLKFVIQKLVEDKKIGTIQGTIQTGSTTRETIYYLRKAGARCVEVIVSYVPTVDGRQVGLYTQNRELIANKYVGFVSSIDELNEKVAKEVAADTLYYNSPETLARGIGIREDNLWFPEWVRFLDYRR
jgi:amidophosphoribosyltransferase